MHLVTQFDGKRTVGKIVETEAYRAPDDKACHAYQNKRTKRTKTMFEIGGTAYVYLCYGIHHLFNVVTAPEDVAHAILIRAIEPIEGVEWMMERRNQKSLKPQLSAGPGVMTKALGITTTHDGIDLLNQDSPIFLEKSFENIHSSDIIACPRIGIDYAEECALWDWRFYIKDSKWVSKKR